MLTSLAYAALWAVTIYTTIITSTMLKAFDDRLGSKQVRTAAPIIASLGWALLIVFWFN